MTIRSILHLPDPRLRRKSVPVTVFDQVLQQLIEDMFETMYSAKGIGLAAPQIGELYQLSVIDVTSDRSESWCLINPKILESENKVLMQEGCLSVPGFYEKVLRAQKIRFKALDREGNPYEKTVEGLLAHCIQHEVDHLEGKLFIDFLSPLKQYLAGQKAKKAARRLKR